MGTEFNILKELSTICATASELNACQQLILEEITTADFGDSFRDLMDDILDSYLVVTERLTPFTKLGDEHIFQEQFVPLARRFSESYLSDIAKPRANAEETYHKYLEFSKRREVKTSYPLLKKTFARLHDYKDKWLDNDIYLAMTIDILFKLWQRYCTDIQDLNSKDSEQAWQLFHSTTETIKPLLKLLKDHIGAMQPTSSTLCISGQAQA